MSFVLLSLSRFCLIKLSLNSITFFLFFFLLQGDSDYCLLLALPCGRDQDDVLNQTQALKAAFINYLQTKLAAGIINIPNPGSNQVRRHLWYV